MKSQVDRKRRAPQKAPGGLDRVIYVRAGDDLVQALDAAVKRERARHPGRTISRADVAREALYRVLCETPVPD